MNEKKIRCFKDQLEIRLINQTIGTIYRACSEYKRRKNVDLFIVVSSVRFDKITASLIRIFFLWLSLCVCSLFGTPVITINDRNPIQMRITNAILIKHQQNSTNAKHYAIPNTNCMWKAKRETFHLWCVWCSMPLTLQKFSDCQNKFEFCIAFQCILSWIAGKGSLQKHSTSVIVLVWIYLAFGIHCNFQS